MYKFALVICHTYISGLPGFKHLADADRFPLKKMDRQAGHYFGTYFKSK